MVRNHLTGETCFLKRIDELEYTQELGAHLISICNQPPIYSWLFKDLLGGRPYSEEDAKCFLGHATAKTLVRQADQNFMIPAQIQQGFGWASRLVAVVWMGMVLKQRKLTPDEEIYLPKESFNTVPLPNWTELIAPLAAIE